VYEETNVLNRRSLASAVKLQTLIQTMTRMAQRAVDIHKTLAEKGHSISVRKTLKQELENCVSHRGIFFSPYVHTVDLGVPGHIASIKAAVYAQDKNRSRKYDAKGPAAAILNGIAQLPLPHVRNIIEHVLYVHYTNYNVRDTSDIFLYVHHTNYNVRDTRDTCLVCTLHKLQCKRYK
jgi:hypothetical protein